MSVSLRAYQEPHFQRLLSILRKHRAALDASDTGTGKTVVALFICKALGVVPLVLGPKTARAGWERLAAMVGVAIEYVNYEKLRGRRKIDPAAQAAYERAYNAARLRLDQAAGAQDWEAYQRIEAALPTPPRAVTQTEWIEEVPWGKGSFIKWRQNYECIIFDEAHRCGGGTSLNSKLMIAAKRQAQYVLALSATAADDPAQLKALGYLLDLHGLSKKVKPSGINWLGFLQRHGCRENWAGHMEFTTNAAEKKRAFEKLHREIFPEHGARMRKAEIPGFPKTILDVKLLTDETGKAKKIAEALHEAGAADALEAVQSSRQKLEMLMVPHLIDLAHDYAESSRLVFFVNFTEPLFALREAMQKEFGYEQVGYISGAQTGKQGEAERFRFLDLFQANKLTALVCNSAAAGESCNMHDPTGQVDRTTFITPCESGRQFKQIIGRVHRDGGAASVQFSTYFAGTYQEKVAERLVQKNFNLDILNDADFLC